jgi:hypothetical protein
LWFLAVFASRDHAAGGFLAKEARPPKRPGRK